MRNVEGKKGRLGGDAGKGMEEKVEREIGVEGKRWNIELCERKRQKENERGKQRKQERRGRCGV